MLNEMQKLADMLDDKGVKKMCLYSFKSKQLKEIITETPRRIVHIKRLHPKTDNSMLRISFHDRGKEFVSKKKLTSEQVFEWLRSM